MGSYYVMPSNGPEWHRGSQEKKQTASPEEPEGARLAAHFRDGMRDHATFHTNRDRSVLDRAIASFRAVLETTEPEDPRIARHSNSLGVALLDRFRMSREADDLDEALAHLHRAYRRTESGTMARARVLCNLVSALEAGPDGPDAPGGPRREGRHERLPSLASLRRELGRTPGVSALERLAAASAGGRAAAAAEGPAAGYQDLATAVTLLPQALWGHRRQTAAEARGQMLDLLSEHAGLASEAAACALEAQQATRAVELLEHGRAVLWEQHLRDRSPREELAASTNAFAGGLLERMDRVRAGLDELASSGDSAVRDAARRALRGDARMDADRWGHPWRRDALGAEAADWSPGRLEQEWESLAEEAQLLLGHRTFVGPDYRADIRPAAGEGPVVYVNVSPWRCDAMIVTREDDGARHLPLVDLSAAEAEEWARRYLLAMTRRDADREDVVRNLLDWLWRTVVRPVLDVLPAAAVTAPARVWWIPTGPLTTLPLHAATPLDRTAGRSALDITVSSYTPNVSVLLRARTARDASKPRRRRKKRHLLVSPEAQHLPGATRTRAHLAELLPEAGRTTLHGADATRAGVGAALTEHAWTHFDCHAVQNLDEPFESHLSLHDEPLTVSDLADISSARAEFAFLAACTTAAGGDLVRDEWISLAAALMYSEFQAVIGTLWPVPDGPTARIAQDVYSELVPRTARRAFRLRRAPAPGLDTSRSAHALRLALLRERGRRPHHPTAWVSFVHYGV